MTTDQRIAEWARMKSRLVSHNLNLRPPPDCVSTCEACDSKIPGVGLCPSCWQRIAECMGKESEA